MRFDDLLGDRQAKAGILPETLIRAVSVEALENLIECFRLDAGSIIVDHNLNLVFQPPAVNAHGAARRRERARIVDQVTDDLTEPEVVPRDFEIRQADYLQSSALR